MQQDNDGQIEAPDAALQESQTRTVPMLLITLQQRAALVEYLSKQPYADVANGIEFLAKAPQIDVNISTAGTEEVEADENET